MQWTVVGRHLAVRKLLAVADGPVPDHHRSGCQLRCQGIGGPRRQFESRTFREHFAPPSIDHGDG